MENYDNDVLGVGNPEHPANQKETFENTEVTSLLGAFNEYESNPTANNKSELLDWIGSESTGAERYLDAHKKYEQYCAWKKVRAERQVKELFYHSAENEKSYQNAIDMCKKLKKQLFEILK